MTEEQATVPATEETTAVDTGSSPADQATSETSPASEQTQTAPSEPASEQPSQEQPKIEPVTAVTKCPQCGSGLVNIVTGAVCPNGCGKIFPKL